MFKPISLLDLERRPTAYLAVCHTCKLVHRVPHNTNEGTEFYSRHYGHDLGSIELEQPIPGDVLREYAGNASVKQAFSGNGAAFTITNANLADSATAGWQSDAVDDSANLYLDRLISFNFAAVNTAPATPGTIFAFAFGSIDGGTKYTSTGDAVPGGAEGTLVFPNVTTLLVVAPSLGQIPYPVQNKELIGGPFSVAACFGGVLPAKWAIGMVNKSGMTLNVTTIKHQGVYLTVA